MAGLNAQLRLVRRGRLRVTFQPLTRWIESYANPALRVYHVRVDLAWFQATACGYCHYGLSVYAIEDNDPTSLTSFGGAIRREQQFRYCRVILAAMLLSGVLFLDMQDICWDVYPFFAYFGLYVHIHLSVRVLLMTL